MDPAPKNPGPLLIRRATVDDLPALKALWLTARLPVDELECRLTEFQVVESEGRFAGAIGVEILRQHACFYAEDYADFAVADAARELFWDRIQKLAANRGVFRVWTREASPFWTRWGLQPATAETLARLPEEWKDRDGRWLTLELKNAEVINRVLEEQLGALREEQQEQNARIVRQSQRLKQIAIAASFVIFLVCLAIVGWLLLHRPLTVR